MATYAEKDFDSDNYNVNRPRYPKSLFDAVFEYHQGSTKLALDIGCGPGTASFPLLSYVDKLIATDPSDVMIKPGIQAITEELKDRIEFKVAPAEDLTKVVPEDGSIDIIISAEALHWVKHDVFFKEAARVLRKGGTLAFWGYVEPRFIDFPEANDIYQKYVYEDPRYMGPKWVQPGKDFLRYFFNDVHVPTDLFENIEKHDYYPGETKSHTAYYHGDQNYTMKNFLDYLQSWSAYHTWQKDHPDENIALMFVNELKETFGWSDQTELRVEWGTTYTFARKK